jgi:hypothetical protein
MEAAQAGLPMPLGPLEGALAEHDQVLLRRTNLLLNAGDVVC